LVAYGFELRASTEGELPAFIPALTIGWAPPCFGGGACIRRRFAVRFAVAALPASAEARSVAAAQVVQQPRAFLVSRLPPFARSCTTGTCLAWLYNSCLLCGSVLLLLHVYHARLVMPKVGLHGPRSARTRHAIIRARSSHGGVCTVRGAP
jgi:hypothetical protein